MKNVKKNSIRDRKTNGSYYVIDWGGLTDVENIYKFLYKDAKTYLDRKKEKYDEVMLIHSKKNKYRKK
jgi:predicted acetyltransferase